ncbi:hypothetical protein XM38_003020 [Halomicronema hongdechloris C2206]|uniref:Uncharacterized protein n=1 Tax=Halomicronema hongdechloris C2206 TaxID=1641165 RepID=A0A1Z3HGK3_9CYAN|nr:hypothetical protein XM38_003020 [Halomicronema hongdechloris C2206]
MGWSIGSDRSSHRIGQEAMDLDKTALGFPSQRARPRGSRSPRTPTTRAFRRPGPRGRNGRSAVQDRVASAETRDGGFSALGAATAPLPCPLILYPLSAYLPAHPPFDREPKHSLTQNSKLKTHQPVGPSFSSLLTPHSSSPHHPKALRAGSANTPSPIHPFSVLRSPLLASTWNQTAAEALNYSIGNISIMDVSGQ